MSTRTPHLHALLFAGLALALRPSFAIATSTIGLYTDENGSSCSFSGNAPGVFSAYVVVKPDASGVQGMRFSAQAPPCLGAVWLTDIAPSGALTIGQSPTGVSVAFPSCAPVPAPALEIQYLRFGNTSSCCAFTIAADPFTGTLESTDCAFGTATLTPVTSHFNADATCPCNDQTPPLPPENPSPLDGLTAVSVLSGLSWTHSPYDFDVDHYDLYFGTNPSPPFVATLAQPAYQPPQPLQGLTQYYWRVVVVDDDNHATSGPVWKFKTKDANSAPNMPALFLPLPGASNVSTIPTLKWTGTDPDGDALEYDIYLGTDPVNLPLRATHLHDSEYAITTPLAFATTYTWKVIARDPFGHETSSAPVLFTTKLSNSPPNAANGPVPLSGATDVPVSLTLQWQGSDPDGQALTFDVFFGTVGPLPIVAFNRPNPSYEVGPLVAGTTYFWRILSRDASGAETLSPTWNFTTASEPPIPVLFTRFGAVAGNGGARLDWELHGDESMQSYTMYRREPGSAFEVITSGAVTAATGSFVDTKVQGGRRYDYQMLVRTTDGDEFRSQTASVSMPALELALGPNHPNPFNPQTAIPYYLPASDEPMRVRMIIYDASGRLVKVIVNENQSPGAHEVTWNGSNEVGATVTSGIYFCVLQAGKEQRTQKLVMLK